MRKRENTTRRKEERPGTQKKKP
jgi:hypothetical protein